MQAFRVNIICEIFIFLTLFYLEFTRKSDNSVLLLDYTDSCLYYGEDLILKLRYNSTNYKFLKYLFDNVGREITEKEVEDKLLYRTVYMNKLVSNLNLPSDLRDKTIHVKGGRLIFDPAGIKKPIKNN